MERVNFEELIELLELAFNSKENRMGYLRRFRDLVGDYRIVGCNSKQASAFEDLGYDISFYSTDRQALEEDSSLIDDVELENRIRRALQTAGKPIVQS